MKVRLRHNQVWRVNEGDLGATGGECDYVHRTITIDRQLRGQKWLKLVLHEGLHQCLPDLDEEAVIQTAGALTRLLWVLIWPMTPRQARIILRDS